MNKEIKTLLEAEREALMAALEAYPNRVVAAKALGISRATLYRRLRRHGISPCQS